LTLTEARRRWWIWKRVGGGVRARNRITSATSNHLSSRRPLARSMPGSGRCGVGQRRIRRHPRRSSPVEQRHSRIAGSPGITKSRANSAGRTRVGVVEREPRRGGERAMAALRRTARAMIAAGGTNTSTRRWRGSSVHPSPQSTQRPRTAEAAQTPSEVVVGTLRESRNNLDGGKTARWRSPSACRESPLIAGGARRARSVRPQGHGALDVALAQPPTT